MKILLKCKKSYYIPDENNKNIPLFKKDNFYEINSENIIHEPYLGSYLISEFRKISMKRFFIDEKISLAEWRQQQMDSVLKD